ncbi:MAG: hypothetical protein RR396_05625, partial [Clostridiales bacterium]
MRHYMLKKEDEKKGIENNIMEDAWVTSNKQILPQYWQMEFIAPKIAAQAFPGQFIMIKAGTGYDPFLRRPMGLNLIDKQKGVLGIIYQVIGRGTELFTHLNPGAGISVTG